MIKVLPNGVWDCLPGDYEIDPGLGVAIGRLLKSKGVSTVADLGAGCGGYTDIMREFGLKVTGVDGNPNLTHFCRGCKVADLSEPQNLGNFDAVVSLETAEHIPQDKEEVFIGNILACSPEYIILSWFPKDGEGIGHVNPRENKWVKDRLRPHGYESDDTDEDDLRAATRLWWFRLSLMVFFHV